MKSHCTGALPQRLFLWLVVGGICSATPGAATPIPVPPFRSAVGIAETIGEPLTLFASDFLPPTASQPWLVGHADTADYFAGWPAEVTLQAWRFGTTDARAERRVLMIGGIHGDEAVSMILPTLLVRQLTAEAIVRMSGNARSADPPTLFDELIATNTQLYIIPLLNPYGTLAGERANFRRSSEFEESMGTMDPAWEAKPAWWDQRKGVDLNRNFPVNLPCAEPLLQRDDGEGTHEFDALGGCHQQHLYYGGLLEQESCQPEPANQWLWRLVQQIRPEVTIALHQEARCFYVDSREPKAIADTHWTEFVEETHRLLNEPPPALPEGIAPSTVEFGKRANGTTIAPEACINDFSPGGYGAALSQVSGVVLTMEMTYDQSDAENEACWFPEGLLFTYSDDLALSDLRNTQRLEALIERFTQPLVQWILYLDPQCPEQFVHERLSRTEARRLLPIPRDF